MVPLLPHTHRFGTWLNSIWTGAIKLVVSNLVAGFQKWVKIVDLWLAIVKQLSEEEKVLGLFFCGCWMVKATSMIFVTQTVYWIPLPFCLVVLQQWVVLPCKPTAFFKLFKYAKYYLMSFFEQKERLQLPSVSSDHSTVPQLSRSPLFSCTGGCFTKACWWLVSSWGCEGSLSCYFKK